MGKKRKILMVFFLICELCGITSILLYFYFTMFAKPKEVIINYIDYKDEIIKIEVLNAKEGESFCAFDERDTKEEDLTWKEISNNICSYEIKDVGSYILYIKNKEEIITDETTSKVLKIIPKKEKYYLAKNVTAKIEYDVIELGTNEINVSIKNKEIATLENNKFTSEKAGTTIIVLESEEIKEEIQLTVTDLIDKMPKNYNYDRSYLTCNKFSESQAKLLDEILIDRVETAGESTRAGVVAAARFLTLEFPYRISYFSENGRMANYSGGYKVDGEGRYYHKGLYLTQSKTEDIKYVGEGPNPWGCMIYSRPAKGQRRNGLDCSGFTTWVVYNGGIDIEDLGAYGGSKAYKNLNDVGEERKLTQKLALSGEIKAGDLLGEVTISEGHSAIIIGIDKNYYYVAESLWIAPLGVNVNKYKKEEIHKYFETVNLMDSVYKEDGNYTAMWY
ncbi:MAG: hypothetical protein E7172_01255 [Firmicutes bacterium]|nr:hypothetical protein [Bacillota bacterium]